MKNLEEDFDSAMRNIHQAASLLNPPAHDKTFLRMINEYGGRETANRLLANPAIQSGLAKLYLSAGGIENFRLSVEYLVLSNPWRQLFTENQLTKARIKLNVIKGPRPEEDISLLS
jgi:hypothetical protein